MKDKWIKVSDRLPELHKDVLLAFQLYGENDYYVTVGYLGVTRVKGLKVIQWDTEHEDDDMIITHWQPIELPEEE